MAITYGMSVKEFWEDSPDLFWAYRFSYFNRIKTEQEIFNQNAWLQGAYNYEAFSVVLGNAFSEQKLNYPKQPYGFENNEKTVSDINKQQNALISQIKNRVAQIQAIKGKNESGTTEEGNTKGGEILNG